MNNGMQRLFRLANRICLRDIKSGELSVLLASLILATATVTAISIFASRIQHSIFDEASEFLAADAKISGTQIVPQALKDGVAAELDALRQSDSMAFQAMAFAGDNMVLTSVKAVDEHYPLKGMMTIADTPFGQGRTVAHGPSIGEAWISPRLFHALGVRIGGTIEIGEASFIVRQSIVKEPDNSQSFFGVSPRVMIHYSDVASTQAVQFGSRVGYAWSIAGPDTQIAQAKQQFTASGPHHHHRWRDIHSGNRSISGAIERADNFLLLAGSLSVLLAGIAIALAARRYAKRQQQQVALLKTFGETPSRISALYAINLLYLACVGLLLGTVGGWSLHELIIRLLGDLIPADLQPASINAYLVGGLSGFVALLAFAAPPLFALRFVSPMSILRSDDQSLLSARSSIFIGTLAMIGLIAMYSQSLVLTVLMILALGICVLAVGLFSSAMIQLLDPLARRLKKGWRLGLANLKRHRQMNTAQVMVFAILFFLLFTMVSARNNLLDQWRQQIPPETPNHFVFNIFPAEADEIKQYFANEEIQHQPFYPMMRGRVVSVNNTSVTALAKGQSSDTNYERELNLTWSDVYGDDNKIVAGQWWDTSTSDENDKLKVSVEESYAEGLQIDIGDTIELSVAGQTLHAKVSSIRSVRWDSMHPNFYMIFNQALINGAGANWLTSFYLAPEQKNVLNTLLQRFPTLSLLEIDQTIEQVRSIVDKISLAVEFILALILVAGFLVLISSIQATLDLRRHESAILRTMGAGQALVRKILLIEFGALGLLAGVIAVIGSEICLYFLQTTLFDMRYQHQAWLWLVGPLISLFGIACIGWLSTRSVVKTPPLQSLRNNT